MSTVRVEGLKISRHTRYSTGATSVGSKVAHEHARTTLKVSIFERSTRLLAIHKSPRSNHGGDLKILCHIAPKI